MRAAQCFGNSRSLKLHCSSQMVVMMFFASFAISSRNKLTTLRLRSLKKELKSIW